MGALGVRIGDFEVEGMDLGVRRIRGSLLEEDMGMPNFFGKGACEFRVFIDMWVFWWGLCGQYLGDLQGNGDIFWGWCTVARKRLQSIFEENPLLERIHT